NQNACPPPLPGKKRSSLGHRRLRRCDGGEKRPRLPESGGLAPGRRDAPNGALAADYARRHQVPRWYDDASALIADPEVDAVYIATPPDSHASYALQAAAAGKPAYVEKPMARHAPECDRMVEAFQRADLPLYVAYYRRRLPRFLAAEELLRSAIGTLTSIQYRYSAPKHLAGPEWRIDAAAAGGGLFLDLGSHALDLIDYLT